MFVVVYMRVRCGLRCACRSGDSNATNVYVLEQAHGLKEAIVSNELYSAAMIRAFGRNGEDTQYIPYTHSIHTLHTYNIRLSFPCSVCERECFHVIICMYTYVHVDIYSMHESMYICTHALILVV